MKTVAVFFVLNFTIISTMVYLLLRHFVQQRDRFESRLAEQHELVRVEREKSEKLLLSILPAHIADRLKHQPGNIADGYADVSVMFADVVNFTKLAEELTPNQVVSFLDEVFTRFDQLTNQHGLDKIKTIGDAYMVVGGLTGSAIQLRRSHRRNGAADDRADHHRSDACAAWACSCTSASRPDRPLRASSARRASSMTCGAIRSILPTA